MANAVFMAHSGVRYLVLATGAILLLVALFALRTGANSGLGRAADRMLRVFSIFLDIQMVLGIATAFLRPFVPMYIGHVVMMVGAITVVHLFGHRLRKLPPEQRSPGLIVTAALIALALIVGGILALQRPVL